MKLKYIADYYKVRLKKGNVYTVKSIKGDWIEIDDELGESGFYPREFFENL